MRTGSTFFLFAGLFVLVSCNSDRLYQKSYPLPTKGWAYSDSLQFDFEVPDTTTLYDLQITIEHTTAFPYRNLYTQVHTVFPSMQRQTQVLSLELMDQVGFWQGSCGGRTCKLLVPIQEHIFFRQPGTYRIVLEQFSRKEVLEGVREISLEVKAVGQRPEL